MEIMSKLTYPQQSIPDMFIVENVGDADDEAIAEFCGYGSRYYGYRVTRSDDNTVVVNLHKD